MGLFILIAMIGVPIAEIAVFIDVGERIGLGPTLLVVILTAIMGTALLRHQGFSVLSKAQASLQENRVPLNELFDGLCLVFAGALLLTPGFVTDSVGFLLFMPPVRALLRVWAARALTARGALHMEGMPEGRPTKDSGGPVIIDGDIIDGDFSDITDQNSTPNPNEPQGPSSKLPPHNR